MKKKSSSKKFPGRWAVQGKRPPLKPAEPFLQKPGGVFVTCLCLFGLVVWIFIPLLHAQFQNFDERGELLLNTHMNGHLTWQNLRWALFSLEYSNWYPLTWISHMLDFAVFGARAWGHHLTNVLLHAANGVLLFLALKRMTGAFWRSLIVAGLFALHPLRVESVAWISERKDVLSAFFGLLTLFSYARYAGEKIENRKSKILNYSLSLLFFACALMSKSMLVTLPCVLLLLDFWPLERWRQAGKWRLLTEKVPFFLLVIPVSILTSIAQANGGQFLLRFPLGFRLETALMGYARYLGKMFWPVDYSVLYPYPDYWPIGELLLAGALIVGMSALAILWRRERPYLLVGWSWFLGTLVPVIGLIPLGAQSMSNRYTYIPMIGILLLVIWGVNDVWKRWRWRTAWAAPVVVALLAGCMVRTRGEIVYWRNGQTLWRRAIAVTTNNFMAHYCLATILSQSNPDEELVEYQKSVDIYPNYENAQRELGVILSEHKRYAEAAGHFEKAIQLDPLDGWSYHNLGITFVQTGRVVESVPLFMKATELDPSAPNHKAALAGVLFPNNRVELDCISNFLATARSDPAGFARFFDSVQFDTNHVALLDNLSLCFATHPDPKLRNGDYAVRLARRACEMTGFKTGDFVAALATAYAEESRFDEAITNAQLACSLASAAGQTDRLKGFQALLEQFRSHQAHREPLN